MGRWLNRDPIDEMGFLSNRTYFEIRGQIGKNELLFIGNESVNQVDYLGLKSCICGPDITQTLERTLGVVISSFNAMSGNKQNAVCRSKDSIFGVEFGWDIRGLRNGDYTKKCKENIAGSECQHSVWVDGGCHYSGSVNYVLYGTMGRLCGDSLNVLVAKIWLYKWYAGNYGASLDWTVYGYHGWRPGVSPAPDRSNCAKCSYSSTISYFHGHVGNPKDSSKDMVWGTPTIEW